MPMTIDGTPMYVYFALGGAVGVATDGTLLWSTTAWKPNIVAPSPLHLGDGRILITSGHGVGSMLLQVRRAGGGFEVLPPLRTWSCREFASEQQTPMLYQDHLYTILPKDGGPLRQRLLCMDLDGRVRWTTEGSARFGLGPYMIADGKMFILEDGGRLTLARVSPERYEALASAQLLDGREAWAPLALADGRMILRDWKTMICLDLRKEPLP
jgi:outer membrane protein assembly factor BamB